MDQQQWLWIMKELETMNTTLREISNKLEVNNHYTKNLNSNVFDTSVSIRQICYGIGFISAILFGFVILVWAKGGFRLF
jgi:hypothetical protein